MAEGKRTVCKRLLSSARGPMLATGTYMLQTTPFPFICSKSGTNPELRSMFSQIISKKCYLNVNIVSNEFKKRFERARARVRSELTANAHAAMCAVRAG